MNKHRAAELIARLTEKAQDWEHIPGGTAPGITPQDVCHAIAGIEDNLTQYLLIVKYGYDESAIPTLHDYIQAETLKLFRAEINDKGWGKRRVQFLSRLSGLSRAVLSEYMSGQLCRRCFGRGHVMRGKLDIPCPVCSGDGHKPWSNRRRATEIGIKKSSYVDWMSRYNRLMEALKWRESYGLRVICEKFGDDG